MIYQAITALIELVLRIRASFRGGADLRQRLVLQDQPDPADIWLHAASVGELTSARPVIRALQNDMTLVVTTNTPTGRDLALGWGIEARLAPLDTPRALTRFLDCVQPGLQVTVENEFWPLRSRMLAERGIAQAMIGTRMSQKSAATWTKLPRIISPMLHRIAAMSAQDPDSENRLRALGLPERAILPILDLKLLTPAEVIPPSPNAIRDRTILAASTHDGEEAQIIAAWQAVRIDYPDLRLILAIRHPQRGDEVANLLTQRGINFARRSLGQVDAQVILADTLGEMSRWYAEAGICLVAGSLSDRGGHTPWEPAAYCCALLHGPHVSNFKDAYAALDAMGASMAIDEDTLAPAVKQLIGDPVQARHMGNVARKVLDQRTGNPTAIVETLRRLARNGIEPDIVRISED